MGGACCKLNQNNRSKPLFYKRISYHQSSHGTTNAGRLENRSASTNQDVRRKQRVQNVQSTRNNKINTLPPQEQELAQVTADESSNDETLPSLKSNKDQTLSLECNIEELSDSPKDLNESESHILPFTEDDDFCPTCLEGYEEENPKILTKCNHHYHLACIFEWQERKNTCPICDKELIIEEGTC